MVYRIEVFAPRDRGGSDEWIDAGFESSLSTAMAVIRYWEGKGIKARKYKVKLSDLI